MATTRIIPMRQNKGKSIAASLKGRTDYAKNPEKTNDGALVSAYECDPRLVDAQFLLAKREYRAITGREQQRNVIAYQVRQSFKPGEITPEDANRIGYDFAMRFLKANHAFIVATHVDKKHIHNHIIWNSTSLDCTRKWRNFWRSTDAVRRLSDTICIENGLSFIENPKGKGVHYGKWLGADAKPTHRDEIRGTIDAALQQKPKDFLALLDALKTAGYEIKQGKNIALCSGGQQRFVRLDSLGEGYRMEDLQAVLGGNRSHVPRKTRAQQKPEKSIQLLVDIQTTLAAGKSVGYERWAKVFNLKQMAKTVNYLTQNELTDYDLLQQKTENATTKLNMLAQEIKAREKRLSEISSLHSNIIQYHKTRDVYVAYRKNGYSKKFLAAHESEILLHKAAKRAFDNFGMKKLPSMASLKSEAEKLNAERKKMYADYGIAKTEMRDLLAAKQNVDKIFRSVSRPEPEANRNPQR